MSATERVQQSLTPQEPKVTSTTIGTVVDTADPMQRGRLRIMCPALGDRPDMQIKDIPWALCVAPFAGDVQVGTRGPNDTPVNGPTAYGWWATPKLGAQVLVMCIDGAPYERVWLGCLHTPFMAHTIPHGRFSYEEENIQSGEQAPAGPYDSFEQSIQPLTDNFYEAFPAPEQGNFNFEFASRAADFQATGLQPNQVPDSVSSVADDDSQGYRTNLQVPEDILIEDSNTQADQREQTSKPNLDNMVTAIVSPGFHAISMDDRPENSRIRFRTAAGHQIIMDDTNERIYISTAKGKNWIEIDQEGNIDIYTSGKLSATADRDINFKTKGSFRVDAEKGIHLNSGKETRIVSSEDMTVASDANLRVQAKQNILAETLETDVSIKVAQKFVVETSKGNIDLNSNNSINATAQQNFDVNVQSGFVVGSNTIDLGARGTVIIKGQTIDLNGANPQTPQSASSANETNIRITDGPDGYAALLPNRQPQHEPWARTDYDDLGEPLLEYDNSEVGKLFFATDSSGRTSERIAIERGPRWRR